MSRSTIWPDMHLEKQKIIIKSERVRSDIQVSEIKNIACISKRIGRSSEALFLFFKNS